MRRQSQPWTWLVVAIAGWLQRDQQAAIVCVFGHDGLRTANLLERTFGEHKRRTKVIPHFFTEEAAMKLSFAVLLASPGNGAV